LPGSARKQYDRRYQVASRGIAGAVPPLPCAPARYFGSAARGDFDSERSDIDFLVEFDRSAPQHPFDAYFGLRETLEELLGRTVDLVEAGVVRNPYLRASIDGSREPVFEA
jgi:hypothetical protein